MLTNIYSTDDDSHTEWRFLSIVQVLVYISLLF